MMLTFQKIKHEGDLSIRSLLHVGKFFNLERTWWNRRKERQDTILSIAHTWYSLVKSNPLSCGFVHHEVCLTGLSSKLKDSRIILEHFFNITRLGFNFGNGAKAPTLITPKRLNQKIFNEIKNISNQVFFDPGLEPLDKELVVSSVKVKTNRSEYILQELSNSGKSYLLPAVKWLLDQNEPINFYYERSGKLQARDKSVWPIKSIETWPGWLRTELFGRVVDIENAYCQFLISCLESKYTDSPHLVGLKYPDIVRSVYDKVQFRNYVCSDLLKLEINEDNTKVVKKLIMSLANGSNVTPQLLAAKSSRSEAVRIIVEANSNLSGTEIIEAGKRLSFIAKQFRSAKKDICINLLNKKPSSKNIKQVFQMYFDWERNQRYKIWNLIGKNGLMLHDGIDGIESSLSNHDLEKMIAKEAQVKVTVES
jgi:hypothetical protein